MGVALAALHLNSRRIPILGVIHGLAGASGFGLLLVALQGPRRGDAMGAGSFGIVAAVAFGLALVFGPVYLGLRRRSPRSAGVVIAMHGTLAITGFAMFLGWISLG